MPGRPESSGQTPDTYSGSEGLVQQQIIFFPNSDDLRDKESSGGVRAQEKEQVNLLLVCLDIVSPMHYVSCRRSEGETRPDLFSGYTFKSETATYSWVLVLKTAGQVRVCPCLTDQLPSGFWSDTWDTRPAAHGSLWQEFTCVGSV